MEESERIGPDLWWLAAIMAFGSFAGLLDATITNVAIGPLASAFDAEIATVQWVVTGYLLAITATLPLGAWAMARFGARETLLFSQAVFLLGSLLSGLAWDAPSLIGFRVLQGIGGGLALPVGQALIAQAAGPRRLTKLMSLVTVPALFAPLVGPSLGGVLVDHASWRWIFLINVPFCLATIGLILWRVRNVIAPTKDAVLDTLGLVLLVPALAGLIYGFSEAARPAGSPGRAPSRDWAPGSCSAPPSSRTPCAGAARPSSTCGCSAYGTSRPGTWPAWSWPSRCTASSSRSRCTSRSSRAPACWSPP